MKQVLIFSVFVFSSVCLSAQVSNTNQGNEIISNKNNGATDVKRLNEERKQEVLRQIEDEKNQKRVETSSNVINRKEEEANPKNIQPK